MQMWVECLFLSIFCPMSYASKSRKSKSPTTTQQHVPHDFLWAKNRPIYIASHAWAASQYFRDSPENWPLIIYRLYLLISICARTVHGVDATWRFSRSAVSPLASAFILSRFVHLNANHVKHQALSVWCQRLMLGGSEAASLLYRPTERASSCDPPLSPVWRSDDRSGQLWVSLPWKTVPSDFLLHT